MKNIKHKYSVILADPPFREIDQHYTLKIKQLKLLPVYKYADENCVLFLLCSFPMLKQGIELINAWGFTFLSAIPWGVIPEDGRLSLGNRQLEESILVPGHSECLLISHRGHLQPSELDYIGFFSNELNQDTIPDSIYKLIETLPGPYLEIFAKSRRSDWHAWGDTVQSDIDLAEGLPVNFLQDQVTLDSSLTIKNTWNLANESKWIIGDAVGDLIKSGIPPQEAYALATTQMEGIGSEAYPYMMYVVAKTFLPSERKKLKNWNLYYEKYKEIRKKGLELKAEKRRMWRDKLRTIPIFREEIERLEELEQAG